MKRFPVGIYVGDAIPELIRTKAETDDGAYGRYFESEYAKYHVMNYGKGVDLKDAGIELKSKRDGSAGAMTIGSVTIHPTTTHHLIPMMIRHIIEKMQEQVIVRHNTLKVTALESHNFANDYYQATLENELTIGLTRVINKDYDSSPGCIWRKVKLAGIGHLENEEGSHSWTFRLDPGAFNFAKNSGQFNTLFDFA